MSDALMPSSAAPPLAGAIGVFDSGVGGLSVLRAIREALPAEDLVYVADSGHAPYGDKSEAHITARTLCVGQWLAKAGVKAITVACNTATVVAVQSLRERTHLPVVAIEPAIKPAVSLTRTGVVGVLATQQTVHSASVARLCALHGADTRILLRACPGWVEQVERADLSSPHTLSLIERDLAPLLDADADTLVLGCTHYPFLREAISALAGPGVTLVDPAQAVARELVRRLGTQVRDAGGSRGQVRFFTSGELAQARAVIRHLWDGDAQVQALPAEVRG